MSLETIRRVVKKYIDEAVGNINTKLGSSTPISDLLTQLSYRDEVILDIDFKLKDRYGVSEEDIGIIRIENDEAHEIVDLKQIGLPMNLNDKAIKILIPPNSTVSIYIKILNNMTFRSAIVFLEMFSGYVLEIIIPDIVWSRNLNQDYPLGNVQNTSMIIAFTRHIDYFSEIRIDVRNPGSVTAELYVSRITVLDDTKLDIKPLFICYPCSLYINNDIIDILISHRVTGNITYSVISNHDVITGSPAFCSISLGGLPFPIMLSQGTILRRSVNITRVGSSRIYVEYITLSLDATNVEVDYGLIVVLGIEKINELRDTTYFDITIPFGSIETIIMNTCEQECYAHICGAEIDVTAPTDGDVDIYGRIYDINNRQIDTLIAKIRAGTTKKIIVDGKYHSLYAINRSTTTDASISVKIVICFSALIHDEYVYAPTGPAL